MVAILGKKTRLFCSQDCLKQSPAHAVVDSFAFSSWSEWNRVYSLVNSTLDDNKHARCVCLNTIRAWKSRHTVPLAVASTADMLDLLSSSSSTELLRLAMAMAIVRFVNGVVDQQRSGDEYVHSVSELATQVGLPLHFVRLRHQATHNRLPAFAELRESCTGVVRWLLETYWEPQHQLLEKQSVSLQQATVVLKQAARTLTKGASYDDVAARIDGALDTLQKHPEFLVAFLTEDSSVLRRCPRAGTPLNNANLERAFGALSQGWIPILDAFSERVSDFFEALLLALTRKLCSASPDNECWLSGLTSCWVVHCLERSTAAGAHVLPSVVKACIDCPSRHTLRVVRVVHSRLQRERLADYRTTVVDDAIAVLQAFVGDECRPQEIDAKATEMTVDAIDRLASVPSSRKKRWSVFAYPTCLPLGLLPDGTRPDLELSDAVVQFGANVHLPDQQQSSSAEVSPSLSTPEARPTESLEDILTRIRPLF